MDSQRILGIVLLVVGVLLLIVGVNASNSAVDQISNTFLGHFTHATTWYLIGGVASGLFGLLMLLTGGKGRNA